MSSKLTQLQLMPWLEIDEYLQGMAFVTLNVGPSGELYLLTVSEPADYREQTNKGSSFAKIKTSKPHHFIITRFDEGQVTSFKIENQHWNYHGIQPLPDDEFLLVCSRSHYRGPDDFDLNGRVFSDTGELRREFLLGDGILDVQTTLDGNIWVSYFDEGIFGNYGWGYRNSPPVGESGLVRWSKFGKKLYEYLSPLGLNAISDCYALNVTNNNDVWFYYYTDFPLVRFRGKNDYAFWNIQVDGSAEWIISGSSSFATLNNLVLFRGGYQQSDKYQLVELMDNHQMKLKETYQFVNEQGKILADSFVVARHQLLFLIDDNRCYRVDLANL